MRRLLWEHREGILDQKELSLRYVVKDVEESDEAS